MHKNKVINFIHFESIPSTNTWAKENSFFLDPQKITCITTSEQTAGKGSRQKQWTSPKDMNLYATFYFCVPKTFSFFHNLGQILSISCSKALEELNFTPVLKWPNDILLNGKKVAGILCELFDLGDRTGVALGIGLNINMPKELTDRISQPSTSLSQVGLKSLSIEDILLKILNHFSEDLDTLELEGFVAFYSYYNQRLAFKGELLERKVAEETINGICQGVSKQGKLLLLLPSGSTTEIVSGDVERISPAQ
jgi:BirA family transcriptional regulator, biotin operon repressor / biotin---[acetyl-CoA-carboxylase] ligase